MSDHSTAIAPSKTKRTTRTRTGCYTCRVRRIKCDETKPICKRCSIADKYCDGYMYQDSIKRDFVLHASRPNVNEPAPTGWLVLEGCEWRNSVISAYYKSHLLMYDNVDITMKAMIGHPSNSNSIMTSLAMRLTSASVNDDGNYFPVRKQNTIDLWNKYHYWLGKTLESVNNDLSLVSGDLYQYIMKHSLFGRIGDLMTTEAVMGFTSWRAHLDGFLTLVAFCGNPAQILGSDRRMWSGIQGIIGHAILHNTVNPPSKHITSIYYIGEEHLISIFGSSSWVANPFPTCLFQEVIKITRLRGAFVLGGEIPLNTINLTAVYGIFQRIGEFDPYNWPETYNVPDIPEVPLTGQIFKLAVTLYGLLTLPVSSSLRITAADKEDQSISSTDIHSISSQLLQLLQTAGKYKKCEVALAWPIAVTGTALAGGSLVDQQLLLDVINNRKPGPGDNRTDRLVRDKLKEFWRSGKTEWDQCWDDDRYLF